jgi:hypothetical protein
MTAVPVEPGAVYVSFLPLVGPEPEMATDPAPAVVSDTMKTEPTLIALLAVLVDATALPAALVSVHVAEMVTQRPVAGFTA